MNYQDSFIKIFFINLRNGIISSQNEFRKPSAKTKNIMEFFKWFNKKKDKYSKEFKEEFDMLDKKASSARIEDKLASNFNEDQLVELILNGTIVFEMVGKKRIRSLTEDYEQAIWRSGFECFEYIINYTNNGDFMEFKINHSREISINLFRLNNIIRHKIDKTDPEQGLRIKPF